MRRALLGVALVAACADQVVLSPPTRSSAAFAVIALLDGEELVQAEAVETQGRWAVRGPYEAEHGVVVIYYDAPLGTFGLTPGPLAVRGDAPCGLLAPAAVWRAAGPEGPFVAAAIPPALASLLVPDREASCGRCRSFTESRINIPGRTYRLEAAAPMSDGGVLGVGWPGELFAIDRTGLERFEGCAPEAYYSVAALGDDHYYLGTADGRIHELALNVRERTCRRVAERTNTSTRTIEWITVSPDGDELFALDVAGRVHRGVGRRGPLEFVLELEINTFKFNRAEGINRAGLAWLEPGGFVASGSFPHAVWWSGGRIRRIEPIDTRLPGDSVSEIRVVDGVVYVGDGGGQIARFERDGNTGRLLPDNPITEIVGSIVPDKDGIIVTTGQGEVGFWYPTTGWCATHLVAGNDDRGRHAFFSRRGDLVIADMIGGGDRPAQLLWLTARD